MNVQLHQYFQPRGIIIIIFLRIVIIIVVRVLYLFLDFILPHQIWSIGESPRVFDPDSSRRSSGALQVLEKSEMETRVSLGESNTNSKGKWTSFFVIVRVFGG